MTAWGLGGRERDIYASMSRHTQSRTGTGTVEMNTHAHTSKESGGRGL